MLCIKIEILSILMRLLHDTSHYVLGLKVNKLLFTCHFEVAMSCYTTKMQGFASEWPSGHVTPIQAKDLLILSGNVMH